MPVYILEQNRSLPLIEAAIEQYRPDVVFLDYIQKLEGTGKSLYEQVTSNTGRLQTLAIRHNCCVVCLSQVSNASMSGSGLGDVIGFKESGAIAADADMALMLYRNKEEYPNILEFCLRKNRHGSEGAKRTTSIWARAGCATSPPLSARRGRPTGGKWRRVHHGARVGEEW